MTKVTVREYSKPKTTKQLRETAKAKRVLTEANASQELTSKQLRRKRQRARQKARKLAGEEELIRASLRNG